MPYGFCLVLQVNSIDLSERKYVGRPVKQVIEVITSFHSPILSVVFAPPFADRPRTLLMCYLGVSALGCYSFSTT